MSLVFSPVLTFLFGAFGGWILKIFVGDSIVSGFNAIFGRVALTADFIPTFCGSLAVIGSYFKSHQTNNNN